VIRKGKEEIVKIKKNIISNEKRKKITCPKGMFKSKAEKNTELALKLLLRQYIIYF